MAIAIICGTLFYFLLRRHNYASWELISQSFPLLFCSYIPSILGHWMGGLALTNLIWPTVLYVFGIANPRFRNWVCSLSEHTNQLPTASRMKRSNKGEL